MPSRNDHTLPLATLLLYALVSGLLLWHHEPWRDELQCWEIARQSASLPELFHNARYEGHPSAWYLLLFAITRFSSEFIAVRWLHWLLALASVTLLLWRSPFGHWQKLLLVFGYFFLFEYGVLTRNYALGILLALCICALMRNWQCHWLAICALLFGMMQCNLFAALLAGSLLVPLSFRSAKTAMQNGQKWQFLFGNLVAVAGFLLSAYDMAPPTDTNYAAVWKWSNPDWQPALGAFFRAMLPVPPFELHGWGSHFLDGVLDWNQRTWTECIGSIVLLVVSIWSLRKSRLAIHFFLLAWLAISLFLAVKFQGYIRHHGHFYLAWVMAFWIKLSETPVQNPAERFPNYFFNFLLLIHVLAAAPMVYFDLRYPFSQSWLAADFLRKHHLEGRFIIGEYDYATSPIAFHLRRPIYYPNQLKKGSYLLWNKEQAALQYQDVVPVVMDIYRNNGDLLLLMSYPLPAEHLNDSIRVLQAFYPAIVGSEEYYLYEVKARIVNY